MKRSSNRDGKTGTATEVSDIGIIGSGVMGSNLGLNIADKSISVLILTKILYKSYMHPLPFKSI